MSRRVLRWPVPIDDERHPIGGGDVIHVAVKPGYDNESQMRVPAREVHVWTVEDCLLDGTPIKAAAHATVVGTGMDIPIAAVHPLGSALDMDGGLVWHVFATYQHRGV